MIINNKIAMRLPDKAVRNVGETYWNGYWQREYTVLDITGIYVTVRWANGDTTRHCTPLDPRVDYRLL